MTGSDTDVRTKLRAGFLAFIMVTSVFGATVAFSGAATATSTSSELTQTTNSVTVGTGESGTPQTITITDTDNDGNITRVNNITISQDSGGLSASDIDQISLVAGGSTVATNSSIDNLNSVKFGDALSSNFQSSGSNSSVTDADSDSDNELVINENTYQDLSVKVTAASSANTGDMTFNTTVNVLSGDDNETFSGGSSETVGPSGTYTISTTSSDGSASESTNDVDDSEAAVNVSVSDGDNVDEDTIDVSVTNNNTSETTVLVNNGSVVNGSATSASSLNSSDDGTETVNVSVPLQEGDYALNVSADDTNGNSITSGQLGSFTVDMAGDSLQVIPDSGNAFANADGDVATSDENASVGVVAVDQFGNVLLDDDSNQDINTSDVALSSQDSSVSITAQNDGNVTMGNATTFNVSNTEAETVTLTAYDTNSSDSTLSSGSAQQEFLAQIAGVDVTSNRSTLPADSESQAQISTQLVDSNGDPVAKSGIDVSHSIENSSAAGASAVTDQSATTNDDGVATINITADTAGVTLTVTGLEQGTGNSYSDSTTVETVPGNINASTSQFSINGEVDDQSDVQVGTEHDLSVTLNDDGSNPIPGATVEFSANQSGASFGSASVTTNDTGVATTTVTLPEQKGTTQLNVSAGAFNASNTGNASINVTSQAANTSALELTGSTSVAPGTQNTQVTVNAVDQYGNVNTSASQSVTLTSDNADAFDFDGSNTTSAALSSGTQTFAIDAADSGTATVTATVSDSAIENTSATYQVAAPAGIDVSFDHDVTTSSASNAQDKANLTAQIVDANGNALGVDNEEISFARLSGSAAELNQEEAQDFTKTTDGDGNVTIQVNATSTTGDTTFLATADNFSIDGEGTITTTGPAESVQLTPESSSVATGDTLNVTASFVDSEGRNVPRSTSIKMTADNGAVDNSPQSTTLTEGQYTATLVYNATGVTAEQAELTGIGGGVAGTTIVEVTDQPSAASVTFDDQTVSNGSTSVTLADYDLGANGQSVAIWTVSDGSPAQVVGQVNSSELDSSSGSDLTVQLDSELSANTTLVAAVHSSTSPTADNILVQDSASITVTESDVPQNIQRFAGEDGEVDNLDVLSAVNAANNNEQIGGEPVDNLDILELVNYINNQQN